MKKVFKTIRNQDVFGYKMTFNFNKQGRDHKTLCGGLMSCLMKLMVTWYVIYKLIILINKGQSNKYTYSGLNMNIIEGK